MYPVLQSETRNEILTFLDGSKLEIDAQMRRDCTITYIKICQKAIQRRIDRRGT
jgi:hypothetical protein